MTTLAIMSVFAASRSRAWVLAGAFALAHATVSSRVGMLPAFAAPPATQPRVEDFAGARAVPGPPSTSATPAPPGNPAPAPGTPGTPGTTQTAAAKPAPAPVFADTMRKALSDALEEAAKSGRFSKAEADTAEIFDRVITDAPDGEELLFRDAAFAARLTRHMARLDEADAKAMFPVLLKHPDIAMPIAFNTQDDADPRRAYAVFKDLAKTRGDVILRYPNLTAALCLVQDYMPGAEGTGDSRTAPPAPDVFQYFVDNDRRMVYSIRDTAPEMLVHVVDVKASLGDMRWALDKFGGQKWVGKFYDVPRYDKGNFKRGDAKLVEERGYNLPNIMTWGGVCIDRAYFAATVGKSVGVPTVIITGHDGGVAHAWVGYLQSLPSGQAWDFESGRFGFFERVRGATVDPMTNHAVADSLVAFRTESLRRGSGDRYIAAAFTDAARRLAGAPPPDTVEESTKTMKATRDAVTAADAERGGKGGPAGIVKGGGKGATPRDGEKPADTPAPDAKPERMKGTRDKPRVNTVAERLALLELAVARWPTYEYAWWSVSDMASRGQLTAKDKDRWTAAMVNLTGNGYPDFRYEFMKPMIATVEPARLRSDWWDREYDYYFRSRRPDLASQSRLNQAQLWADQGDIARAAECYDQIALYYGNKVPEAATAILRHAKLLADNRASLDEQANFYKSRWTKLKRPEAAAAIYATQSNWYRVGAAYLLTLRQAGRDREADNVQRLLDATARE